MEYDLGKMLEQMNEKLDALLMKAYPEQFKKEPEVKK